jgi:NAD(P)-dependent dehydrogenase (short-subunit alcohol dehydrogenase family)
MTAPPPAAPPPADSPPPLGAPAAASPGRSGPEQAFRLDGRVAVVTGASSGLGERFARTLAAAGAHVVAAARRRDRLAALADEVPGLVAVPTDVTAHDDCESLVQGTLERFGRIDVLVNNAGIADGGERAETEDPALFRQVLEVNLTAVFVLCRLVGPHMLERGSGSIVNISSVHGLVASTPNRQLAYDASKGGVTLLTRELACQWARKGVRVNALAPGYIETELTGPMFAAPEGLAWIERETPLGRAGDPGELDGALLLLASDAGSYITGHTLCVDGGWTAR